MDSLLKSNDSLFASLNRLPFFTYINVGLESADPATLALLKKPVNVKDVEKAFKKMFAINRKYEKVEVTANFVFGGGLPQSHFLALCELTGNTLTHFYNKGAVYLSPFIDGKRKVRETKRELLKKFNKVKALSRLPTFIYLIQRL